MSEESTPAGSRPIWSGTISFGLVSIPVNLLPGVREGRVSLRLLGEDGTPLSRRFYCPRENREIHPEHIIRGFEVGDEQYVVITDEELESVEPVKSRDIDLRRFVQAADIDPMYFDRAYYLVPANESTKAYRLLAETMEKSGRAGIATFVMREKEYLVAILAEDGVMRAETMRFHDEVRTPEEIGLPDEDDAPAREAEHVEKAIRKLTDTFRPADFEDRYKHRLLELIGRKEEKNQDVVQGEPTGETEGRSVRDLMAALSESLASARAERDEKDHPSPKRQSLKGGRARSSRTEKTRPERASRKKTRRSPRK